jgi:cyclic pyranopterin phosphate synthase
VRLIAMLKSIDGIEDIALSTNGVKLPTMAADLKAAGLDRVNISADSLQHERIVAIARRDFGFDPVGAMRSALDAGLDPVKVNVVVMRGVNDDEIEDFARLTLDHAVHVRFIELMPVGEMAHLTDAHIVPSAEVLQRVSAIGALAPSEGPARGNGPATYHRLAGAAGTVGVITPMTHTYCGTCNRVRLTCTGTLYMCLGQEDAADLRAPMRDPELGEEGLRQAIRDAIARKPKGHDFVIDRRRRTPAVARHMSVTGG